MQKIYVPNDEKISDNSETKIARLEKYINSKYEIRVNEITTELEAKKGNEHEFSILNLNDLHLELYHAGFSRFKEEINTLFASSKIKRFDPLKDYFETLKKYEPNFEPDYILDLSSYIKTNNQEWFEIVFKKFLVQVCGQAMNKIEFNKYCLTFVGKQHDGKTTFLEFLVPNMLKGYLKKGFDFGGNKDAKFSLIQNIIINLDELASFSRKELNNEFKSVLSENIVKYRPLYSNQETAIKRRASFVASTNQLEFLTDETGNVRWLIFKIENICHDNGGTLGYNQNIDINRVWAQAYHLLKSGYNFDFTKEEIKKIEEQNRQYLKTTDEMEFVRKYFKPADKETEGSEFLTASEIMTFLNQKGLYKTYRTSIGKALNIEGFQLTSKYCNIKGYSTKGYYVLYT